MKIGRRRSLPKPKKWDVFLSYRRSEATENVARWIQRELKKKPITSRTGQRFTLNVFVDVTQPYCPNFQRNLTPILKNSRALIVLADSGAAQRKPLQDYLYEELDWWADNRRKTPFIIVQLQPEAAKTLLGDAKFKANGWDKVNPMDCLFDKWRLDHDGGATQEVELVQKLRESIRDFGLVVDHYEERRLKRRALIAVVFAALALIGALFSYRFFEEASLAEVEKIAAQAKRTIAENQATLERNSKIVLHRTRAIDLLNAEIEFNTQAPEPQASSQWKDAVWHLVLALKLDQANPKLTALLWSVLRYGPPTRAAVLRHYVPAPNHDHFNVNKRPTLLSPSKGFSPDSQHLAVSWLGSGVKLINLRTGGIESSNEVPWSTLKEVSWSTDGKYILAASEWGWSRYSTMQMQWEPIQRFTNKARPARYATWNPTGRCVAYLTDFKELVVIDVTTGERKSFECDEDSRVAWSNTGRFLIFKNREPVVWEWESSKNVFREPKQSEADKNNFELGSLSFSESDTSFCYFYSLRNYASLDVPVGIHYVVQSQEQNWDPIPGITRAKLHWRGDSLAIHLPSGIYYANNEILQIVDLPGIKTWVPYKGGLSWFDRSHQIILWQELIEAPLAVLGKELGVETYYQLSPNARWLPMSFDGNSIKVIEMPGPWECHGNPNDGTRMEREKGRPTTPVSNRIDVCDGQHGRQEATIWSGGTCRIVESDTGTPIAWLSLPPHRQAKVSWDKNDGGYRFEVKEAGTIFFKWTPPKRWESGVDRLAAAITGQRLDASGSELRLSPAEQAAAWKEVAEFQFTDPAWDSLRSFWVEGRPPAKWEQMTKDPK